MADPIAKLNSDGQLVSRVNLETIPAMPPINVNGNSNRVPDLNADKVDNLDASSFLRSDENSTIEHGKTLLIDGKIEISGISTGGDTQVGELNLKPGGVLRLGWFEIKTAGNLMYFEYSPQEYTTG